MPDSPSPEQVAALQQAMGPAALVPDQTAPVDGDDGSVSVDFELPFAVSLITILPAASAMR